MFIDKVYLQVVPLIKEKETSIIMITLNIPEQTTVYFLII
ncbi:protein of unknown function [Vibrio tapetis subsp. tapetis]|uniref:Uncharacterized protein n=1 Tax=Vibrio tapetis subsp. tapetis TaxID=1671868 RepID=A0A2N8ZJB2_9VIBR|nr:protein of unknown function [Vibrio tapetis subsp. tapetis]